MYRRFVSAVVLVGLLSGSAPLLSAQESDPPWQYGRAKPYDMKHVRLEVSVTPSEEAIAGSATLRFAAIGKNLRTVSFDAADLDVSSVTAGDGRALSYENTGETLLVYADDAFEVGNDHTVAIEYSARPNQGLYFRTERMGYAPEEVNVWSQGETEHNRHWFPSYDYPNDRATSEIIVTVPKEFQAYANGVLVSRSETESSATYHWRQEVPHTNYLISMVIGKYVELDEAVGDIPLKYIVRPAYAEHAMLSFSKTAEMMTFFEEWIGLDYPYAGYSQIGVVDFIYGGMENTGITTLTERTLHDPSAHETYSSDGLVAHELAHQWWGDLLTCRDWSHLWLNEGFATYFDALFREHDRGRADFLYQMLELKERYYDLDTDERRAPVVKRRYTSAEDAINRRVYNKGAWILHMLRSRLGDERFQAGIRAYGRVFQNSAVETNQLMRTLEDTSGEGLERFFDQWLFQAGYPTISMTYSWDEENGRANVVLVQTQTVDEQTPLFHFEVPIAFYVDGETVRERVRMTEKRARINLSLPSRPDFVHFDPEGALLKKLEFKAPKSMLLTQLVEDANILGRIEAVEGLTRFGSDDVVEALGDCLKGDSFWGVRIRAARALGELDHEDAVWPLVAALADDDARVRRAAAAALAKVENTTAAGQALVQTVESDTASHVVARALKSLGALSIETATPTVRAALSRDSHNEVIRIAALNALGELEEDSAIATFVSHTLNDDRNVRAAAISALGKFGRWMEDTAEIREVLVSQLDDPARRIRVAAVNALSTLGDEKAIPAIARVEVRTKNTREKKAAERALAALHGRTSLSGEIRALRESVEAMEESHQELLDRVEELEVKASPQS